MNDRYTPVVESVLRAILKHTCHDFSNDDPLFTELHLILRTQGAKAVLRSHCDRFGHQPVDLIRDRETRKLNAQHKITCTYCGIELKAVDE